MMELSVIQGAIVPNMAVSDSSPSLGDVLVRENVITPAQLHTAREAQKASSHSLGIVLVELEIVSEGLRIGVLQKTFGFELADLSNIEVESSALDLIPEAFAYKHRLLPFQLLPGRRLCVAMEDPSDYLTLDLLKAQTGLEIKPYVAVSAALAQASRIHYRGEAPPSAPPPAPRVAPMWSESRLFRVVRYTAFPVLCFAPLAILLGLVLYNESIQEALLSSSMFDIGLYTLLGWGLWAVILFYINSLVFKPAPKKQEASGHEN